MKPSQIPLFRNFTVAFMVGVYVFPTKTEEQKQENDRSKPNRLSSAEGKICFWFSRKTAGTNAIYQSMTKLFSEKSKGEQDLDYSVRGRCAHESMADHELSYDRGCVRSIRS